MHWTRVGLLAVAAPFLASCQQVDPIAGRWVGGGATLELTRDGTWILQPDQPTVLFQGMSGRWSRTESGSYILVSDPLPFGNTLSMTGEIEGGALNLDMMGQRLRLTREGRAPQEQPRAANDTPAPSADSAPQQAAANPPIAPSADDIARAQQRGQDAVATAAGEYLRSSSWLERPSAGDFAALYPAEARTESARVQLDCLVGDDGRLNCSVASVDNQAFATEFGVASLRLAPRFRMAPALNDGTPTAGRRYRLNLRWSPQ